MQWSVFLSFTQWEKNSDCFVENCLGNLTAKGLLKSATISRNYDKPSSVLFLFPFFVSSPSVLWRCWLGGRKGIRPVKTEWWGAGVVICLERGADLHMAQLTPLPLTVSCFSKILIGLTFLVPAHLGSPGQRAVKQVCVCVCFVFVSKTLSTSTFHYRKWKICNTDAATATTTIIDCVQL